MSYMFELIDKANRKIHLTQERWKHIQKDHPDVQEEEIKKAITSPVKIIMKNNDKYFYYLYCKYKKSPARYLRTVIKYLNGEGYVITAYFVRNI